MPILTSIVVSIEQRSIARIGKEIAPRGARALGVDLATDLVGFEVGSDLSLWLIYDGGIFVHSALDAFIQLLDLAKQNLGFSEFETFDQHAQIFQRNE